MRVKLDHVSRDEFNTLLAALRWYQHSGMGEPDNRPDWLQEIACSDGGSDISLGAAGIDNLCWRLNTSVVEAPG